MDILCKDDVELAGIRAGVCKNSHLIFHNPNHRNRQLSPALIWSNGEHFARAPYSRESREQVITGPSVIRVYCDNCRHSGWRTREDGVLILDMEEKRIASNVSLETQHLEVSTARLWRLRSKWNASTNSHLNQYRERLDFSCSPDASGYLVMNAPYSVHLGAMGETVRSLIQSKDVRTQVKCSSSMTQQRLSSSGRHSDRTDP